MNKRKEKKRKREIKRDVLFRTGEPDAHIL
jgi:hypothetical protein